MSHQVRALEILEAWNQKPLTPAHYCQIWVSQKRGVYPSHRGYRKACLHELQRVLGLSRNTINCWGVNFEKCKDQGTLLHLRRVHISNVQMLIIASLNQPVSGNDLVQMILKRLELLEHLCSKPSSVPPAINQIA